MAVGAILTGYVEEEELAGGNEDDVPGGLAPDGDGNYPFVGHQNLTTDKIGGSLGILWGGDDSNKNANGGFTGTQVDGDRSVVFAGAGGGASVRPCPDSGRTCGFSRRQRRRRRNRSVDPDLGRRGADLLAVL